MPEGLRQRKRTAAMLRIQSVALDLFEERGFEDVTIEEIAAASEVSPSSVYRYFGTKEEIVLWDEFDPPLVEHATRAMSHEVPLVGLRQEIDTTLAALTPDDERRIVRRLRLAGSHPSLEAATVAHADRVAVFLEQMLARQLGRPVEDLEVQVFAHAFTGGFIGTFHHWQGTGFAEPMREVVARTFEIFEEGLDIVTASASTGGGARDVGRDGVGDAARGRGRGCRP